MAETPVRMSSRSWSQEVAMADAKTGYTPPRKEWVYEWSNGKRYVDPDDPYAPPGPPDEG